MDNGNPIMDDPAAFAKAKAALNEKRFEIRLSEAPEQPVDELTRLRAFFHSTVLRNLTRAAYGSCTEEEMILVKNGLKELLLCILGPNGEVVGMRSSEDLDAGEYADFIEGAIRYGYETYADFSI